MATLTETAVFMKAGACTGCGHRPHVDSTCIELIMVKENPRLGKASKIIEVPCRCWRNP